VELAQLKYILPRLKGYGNVLSRTGGGIGTRGPEKRCWKPTAGYPEQDFRLKKELSTFTGTAHA
jgi:GTP-binding protein HflX